MVNSTKDKRQTENNCLEQASIMSGGGCGVCERQGFPLFLVRKSVVPKYESLNYQTQKISYDKSFYEIPWSQGMVSLDGREPTESLETHESCFRLLRGGYVYIFLRSRGVSDGAKRAVLAYEVTPSGCFRHKPIKSTTGLKSYQVEEIPPSCVKKNHYIPARFVTVDHTRYSHAWVAYSAHPWRHDVLEHYRALPEAEMKRFTCITLPKNATAPAADLTTGRSFSSHDFFSDANSKKDKTRYLMELEFDPRERVFSYYDVISQHSEKTKSTGENTPQTDTRLTNNHLNSTKISADDLPEFHDDFFYTSSQFNSLKADTTLYYNQITTFNKYFTDTPAIVVEDCLGLAEELAVQKRIALRRHAIGLLKTEANVMSEESQAFLPKEGAGFIFSSQVFAEQKALLNAAGHQNHDLYQMMYSELVGDAEQDVGSFNAQIVKRDRALFEKKKAMGPLRYDYHEREMIFKRRLLSNIENFEQGIIDKCESQTPPEKLEAFFYSSIEQYQMMPQSNMHFYRDNIYYQLKYQENDVNTGFSKDPHHADLYTEITDISVADKKSLLAQFNQHYYKNRTGMNKNSPDIENLSDDFGAQHIVLYRFQPKPRYKELEKYQALINRPLLTLFKEELALSYNWMMDDIKLITQDYYTYATWLIADPTKAKLSKFGPQLSVYNDVPFWLTEVSADCSNAHIGYLMDMVTIFQPEYLGSVKLDYQFSLWDNLLRDENTLYTHLLKGGQPEGGNLWDKLIALREDRANEKKSTDELIDAMYQAIEQQALQPATGDTAVTAPNAKSPTQLDTEAVGNLNDLLDLPTDKDQTKLAVRLFDLLNEKTYISLANMPKGEVINRVFAQKQLADSAMALFGRKLKVFTFDVKARDLRYAMNALQKSNPTILSGFTAKTAEGQIIPMAYDSGSNKWTVPISERNKVVQLDVVTMTNNAKEMEALEAKLQQSKTFNQFVKKNDSLVLMSDKTGLTQADFDAAFAFKRREIMIEEGKSTLFQGLLLALNVYNLSTQYGAYDLGVAQDQRDKMRGEMSKTLIDVMLMLPPLVNSGARLSAAAFSGYLNRPIQDTTGIVSQLKVIGLLAKWAGVAASMKTIYDGACSYGQGLSRYQEGEGTSAALYMVGSVCQMASGALSAIALLFPAMPYLAVIVVFAFIFGLAAWLLLSLFKDPSDEWDAMQTWFNRSYFGKWTHKKNKGEPYPPTDAGYCLACNDYTVALLNCFANVAIEDRKYASQNYGSEYYATQAMSGKLFRNLQLNMTLSGFDNEKSDYKGLLMITDRKDNNKTILLSLSKRPEHVHVKENSATMSTWHMRSMDGIEIKKENNEHYEVANSQGKKISMELSNIEAPMSLPVIEATSVNGESKSNDLPQKNEIYFLRVAQILGNFNDSGITIPYNYQLVIHYWRDKTQDSTPLVISYEYAP